MMRIYYKARLYKSGELYQYHLFLSLCFSMRRYCDMKYFSQLMLLALAVLVLLGLQYQYWWGENGHFAHNELLTEIDTQQRLNGSQLAENDLLRTDVNDLKNGLEAVEEHARLDLGLIKPNETFVQVSTAPSLQGQ